VKIGFDGKRATHNFRGLGNYSRGLIEGLYHYTGHQLYLYTPNFKDNRANTWLQHFPKLNVKTPQGLITKNFQSYWRSFSLGDDLTRDHLDIYHGLSHEIPKLPKNRKFKTVVTIHDLIFLRYPEYFPKLDRMVYLNKFKYSCENSDLIISICEQTKSDLINFLNVPEEKIKIHYQSASPVFYQEKTIEELEHFKANHQLNRPYILLVGAFEERKNQKGAIKAFNLIKNEFDIDLVLVGTGKKYLKEARELIVHYQLEKRVRILNHFPFHSLPMIYQAADLFFFPSFFEGFGIPIVEALYSKVPVVTSFGSCFPESAGPDSVYCDPAQIESMADALRQVLRDKKLQFEMKNKGHEFVQRFSLESTTKKLNQIYKSL
jgi:glycosyltransferase involved in cell wall biosynthesis